MLLLAVTGSTSMETAAGTYPSFICEELQATLLKVQALVIKQSLHLWTDWCNLAGWECVLDLALQAVLDCCLV